MIDPEQIWPIDKYPINTLYLEICANSLCFLEEMSNETIIDCFLAPKENVTPEPDEVLSLISELLISDDSLQKKAIQIGEDACFYPHHPVMLALIKLQKITILNRINIKKPVSSHELDGATKALDALIQLIKKPAVKEDLEKNLSDLKSTFWRTQTLWARLKYTLTSVWKWLTSFVWQRAAVSPNSLPPTTTSSPKPCPHDNPQRSPGCSEDEEQALKNTNNR